MIGVGTKSKKAFNSNPNEVSTASSSVDFVSCPNIEGLLKKKNSHGQWKDRYCLFQNGFFLTYKPKGSKPSSELKESIDLKDVEGFLIKDDVLHLDMRTGETLLYKGNRLKDWLDCMKQRSTKAQQLYQKALVENANRGIHISGWLQKKSHNKYQGFQERYVKVEGHFLRYYKRDIDTEELGSANLVTTDFIRPYDDTVDCTIFELQDEDRVFVFQANSNKEMMHWISVLEKVRLSAQAKIQEEIQKKIVEETPVRIRWFDELGEEVFQEKILKDLADVYPDPSHPPDGDGEFSIKDHLDCATGIVEYLQGFVPEIQKSAQRPARYDILAVMMTMINSFLYDRMSTFLIVSTLDAQRLTMKRQRSRSDAAMFVDQDDEDDSDDNQNRSELIENATLGDLHAIIDWIAKYQITIKKIRCPVANKEGSSSPSSPVASSSQAVLSTKYLSPKQSRLFELLPDVCKLYVYGGSKGSKGGAASHLYDHCMKVWESVVNNPEEMLQRNNDGSFYTHSPVDMWEAINQHISLATSTNSPILHVMIADKVVTSLIAVFENIITYVNTLDTSAKPELREIELEYISALANDTALHIEEVIELIDNFAIAEIRERIDEIFDPLTTILVKCGETCLKRLAGLVMSDVQALLDQVFMPEWMEGNQMHVATATISDYMGDFEEYLVSFWADKFVYTILEEVILSYTRSLLFRKNRPPKTVTTTVNTETPSTPQKNGGFLSSFFQKTKQTITQTITTTVPSHVIVDEESLGRLAQDVNTLNAFFSQKAGQETATEFLALMNEISLLLFLDMAGLLQHFTLRCTEYPSAAQAIYEVINAVMKMRIDDFTKSDFDFFTSTTQSLLTSAIQEAREKEANGVVEGRLGLLYIEVVPKELFQTPQRITLAQRMKMMSNIPMFGKSTIKKKSESEEWGDEEEDPEAENRGESRDSLEKRANSDDRLGIQKSNQLLDDVMEVLQQQDLAEESNIQEEERAKQEEEMARKKIGMLSYDGYLEKKSPAHNLWQKRYFKFMTRETHSLEKPYLYSLMWYKKEGGSVIKALEIDKVQSIAIICSNRALSYVLPPRINSLVLQSEAGTSRDVIQVSPFEHEDNNSGKQGGVDFYIFRVLQTDGKDHNLRSAKIDRIMKWVNTIAFAGSLAYDGKLRQWTRAAFTFYEEQAAERAKVTSFQTVTATPLPTLVRTTSNSSATSETNHSNEIDVKGAALLLQSLKESTPPPPPPPLPITTVTKTEEEQSDSSGGASDTEDTPVAPSLASEVKGVDATVKVEEPVEEFSESVNPIHRIVQSRAVDQEKLSNERNHIEVSEGEGASPSVGGNKRVNRGGRGGNRHKPPPPPSDNSPSLLPPPPSIESPKPSTTNDQLYSDTDETVRTDGVGSFENSPKPNHQRRSVNVKRLSNSRAQRLSLTNTTTTQPVENKQEANNVDHKVQTDEGRQDTSTPSTQTQSLSVDSHDSGGASSVTRTDSASPKSSLKKTKDRERAHSRASMRVSFAEHLSSSDEGRTIQSFEVEEKDKLLADKGGKKKGCADACLLL